MFPSFDANTLRLQFPALHQELNGKPIIFLDGPGGTQTPQAVIDAMMAYLLRDNSNLGGHFITSQRTDSLLADTRRAMAGFFNARRPEEIVFGLNMTTLTFHLSRALSQCWQPGDEIIVTRLDHDANITPWVLAAQDRGVTVRWLDFHPEDCTLCLEDLAEMLTKRTRLVAVTYASNAVGTITDVPQVVKQAHEVGALVYVDAVHYAPHAPIDVQALDCDFLVCSAYKFFGPHYGILYGKYTHLDSLSAYKVRPSSSVPPGKWETGTQSFESIAGIRAAIHYLAMIGRVYAGSSPIEYSHLDGRRLHLKSALHQIKSYEQTISLRFLQGVAQIPGIKIYGITDIERLAERTPTFAIHSERFTPRQLAQRLGEEGIFVWNGHYYAVAVMERLGLLEQGGLVRIGFVHYNTLAEIDTLLNVLNDLMRER